MKVRQADRRVENMTVLQLLPESEADFLEGDWPLGRGGGGVKVTATKAMSNTFMKCNNGWRGR